MGLEKPILKQSRERLLTRYIIFVITLLRSAWLIQHPKFPSFAVNPHAGNRRELLAVWSGLKVS